MAATISPRFPGSNCIKIVDKPDVKTYPPRKLKLQKKEVYFL
jgi:hypothetical protein